MREILEEAARRAARLGEGGAGAAAKGSGDGEGVEEEVLEAVTVEKGEDGAPRRRDRRGD